MAEEQPQSLMLHTHPVYGSYTLGWKSLQNVGFPLYEVNEHSQVRNVQTGLLLKPTAIGQVCLACAGKKQRQMKLVYHLTLLAFFPDEPPNESVDHISEDHDDHFLENLQWCTKRYNSEKSHKLQTRNTGPAQS